MAGTCREFGFRSAQSRAPPGRDLESSEPRPCEPSGVQTPPAVGGWGRGLWGWTAWCVPGQGRPHAHHGGTVQAGVPDGGRGHGEAAAPGQDRAPPRGRLPCGAGRRPALETVPRERPRPLRENKSFPRAQNFPVNKKSQGAWWSLFERASRTHVTRAWVTSHTRPSDCGVRRRACPPAPEGHLPLPLTPAPTSTWGWAARAWAWPWPCGRLAVASAGCRTRSLRVAHPSRRGPRCPGRRVVRGRHQEPTGRRLCWTEQPGGPPGGGGVSTVTGES